MQEVDNWDRLRKNYCKRGVALALGAGVSYDSKLPGWCELLERIAQGCFRSEDQTEASGLIANMIKEGYSLPSIASVLEASSADSREFGEILRDALYRDFKYYRTTLSTARTAEFRDSIKRDNPTLSAVAALCARKDNLRETYNANPLIHAVANTNFDALMTEYSRARLGTAILRTVDRPSARAIQGRIDVYHVHGFFQFIGEYIGDSTKEAPDIRVFTEQEFFDFFNRPNSLFNYTFLYLLRKYTVLFIGMSLKDDNVRRLLHYTRNEIKESYDKEGRPEQAESRSIRHYAIQQHSSPTMDRMTETSLLRLGVRTLWVRKFNEVPTRLAELYESAGLNWRDVY